MTPVMRKINEELDTDHKILKETPLAGSLKRLDEAMAARAPILKWEKSGA